MSDTGLSAQQQLLVAVIAAFASVVASVVAYFGGRGSIASQLQGQINASFELLASQLNDQHDRDVTRMAQMEGHISALEQYQLSLERILRDAGIPIPTRPIAATVFVLAANIPAKGAAA